MSKSLNGLGPYTRTDWVQNFVKEAFNTPEIKDANLNKEQCLGAIQEVLVSHGIIDFNKAQDLYRKSIEQYH